MKQNNKLLETTKILKKKLMLMMIQKWNGKDFTRLKDLSNMADNIIEVIANVGNNDL